MSFLWLAAAVYVAGVVWGLLLIDASGFARLGLALLWPLGPIAFLVTLVLLLAVSVIAFPLFGLAVLTASGIIWLVLP